MRSDSSCGLFQIVSGKLVFSIMARCDDANPRRNRNLSRKVNFARLRQKMNFDLSRCNAFRDKQ